MLVISLWDAFAWILSPWLPQHLVYQWACKVLSKQKVCSWELLFYPSHTDVAEGALKEQTNSRWQETYWPISDRSYLTKVCTRCQADPSFHDNFTSKIGNNIFFLLLQFKFAPSPDCGSNIFTPDLFSAEKPHLQTLPPLTTWDIQSSNRRLRFSKLVWLWIEFLIWLLLRQTRSYKGKYFCFSFYYFFIYIYVF